MRKPMLLVCLLIPFLLVRSQDIDSAWVMSHYTKTEKSIPMRDGVKLFTSIYTPNDNSQPHPILITRTPYSCAPYGNTRYTPFWNSYTRNYLREGYIMVFQDVRGRWMSEGDFVNVRPFNPNKKTKNDIDEASDTYDAIDWLTKHIPHNNGRVGIYGISYPGFYSTMAAASGHPALKAVSPQAPVTNWFIGDDFHHNGAFFVMDGFDFYSVYGFAFGRSHPGPLQDTPVSIGYPIHDNYKFFLQSGTLANIARIMGDSVPFWKELYAHPDYDDWWKARDARNATKNLKPAMLWVGGCFDAEDNWGAWNAYQAAEENNPGKTFNKLVMGPWSHEQWANQDGDHLGNVQFGSNTSAWYQQHIEIPFFNFFLKGTGNIDTIAEATIFVSGANVWKKFSQWPPKEKTNLILYFQPDGGLDKSPPAASTAFSEYVSDPAKPVPYTEDVHFNRTRTYMTDDQRFADRRTDVLSFKTVVLPEDLTVTGNVSVKLRAAISTTDADFVVKLIDAYPDSGSYNTVDIYANADPALIYPMGGYEMLVHGEISRGRYRNSYEHPGAFTPDSVDEVKFKIGDVAHCFKKGHRIMVQVQSSWFPLADRNPQQFVNIYQAKAADFIKSTVRIYHDAKNQSSIELPVLTSE